MIYVDSSVALAAIFVEARSPPHALWSHPLVSSRLLQFEMMNRINARTLGPEYSREAALLISQILLIDLTPETLARALQPFPIHVRTSDSLHLATMVYLRSHGQIITLASYDHRFVMAATALGFEVAPPLK